MRKFIIEDGRRTHVLYHAEGSMYGKCATIEDGREIYSGACLIWTKEGGYRDIEGYIKAEGYKEV